MSRDTETITRENEVAAIERDIADARRAITMAEVDLIFAAQGNQEHMNSARQRLCSAAQILTRGLNEPAADPA